MDCKWRMSEKTGAKGAVLLKRPPIGPQSSQVWGRSLLYINENVPDESKLRDQLARRDN